MNIDLIGCPMIITNEEGNIKKLNSTAVEAFGYQSDEVLNEGLFKLFLRGQNFAKVEKNDFIEVTCKDGSLKNAVCNIKKHEKTWVCTLSLVGGGGGSDTKKVPKEVSRIQSLLASMPTPVVRCDLKMRMTFVNMSATHTFGYKKEELIGQKVNMLMTNADNSKHDAYVKRYEHTGDGRILGKLPRHVEGKHKNGDTLSLVLTITGDGNGYTAIFQDNTRVTQQNERIEAVFASMANPVVISDQNMRITYVNPNAQKVFGYTSPELMGEKVNILMTKEEGETHDTYVNRYETTGESQILGKKSRLVIGRHKDGSDLSLRLTITKSVDGYTAVFTDVTEVSRLTNRLSNIFESMAAPVVSCDRKMRIVYVNQNCQEVFGYQAQELINKKVNVLMNGVDMVEHDKYVQKYQQTGESKIIGKKPRLVVGVHKDGSPLSLYLTITKHQFGYTAIFSDITRSLRHEKRIHAIFTTMAAPVVMSDNDMNIVYVNPNAIETFGYSADELIGKNVTILMTERNADHHDTYVKKYEETGQSTILNKKPHLVTGLHKSGKELSLYLTITQDNEGYTAVFKDVTTTKQVNQRLSSIFESMASPVIECNSAMQIVYANPNALEVFGYKLEEMHGNKVNMLMGEKDKEKHDDYVERFERTGEARIIGKSPRLIDGVRSDGTNLKLYLTVTKTENGYTAVFTDATQSVKRLDRVNNILESMCSPVVICNKSMIITWVNPNCVHVFGYPKEELVGEKVNVLMTDDDKYTHDGYVQRYVHTGRSKIIGKLPRFVSGRHKDGSKLHLYLSITTDEDGYTAVFTDCTENHRQAERTTKILSSMATPVIVSNSKMEIKYANKNAVEVFGYTEDELLGEKVNMLMNARDGDGHDIYVRRYLETRQSGIIGKAPRFVEGAHKDGSILYLYLTITHDGDEFTAVFTDVTEAIKEKKRTEQLSSMSSPVILTDENMNIEYVNQCAVDVFQFSEQEMVGNSIIMLLQAGSEEMKEKFIQDILDEQRSRASLASTIEAATHHSQNCEQQSRHSSMVSSTSKESHHSSKASRASRLTSQGSQKTVSDFSDTANRQSVHVRTKTGKELIMVFTVTASDGYNTFVFMDMTKDISLTNQLSSLIRAVPTTIIVTNRNLMVQYVNPHGLRTFGYSASEVRNKSVDKFSPELQRISAQSALDLLNVKDEDEDFSPDPNLVKVRTKYGNALILYATVTIAEGKFTFVLSDVTQSHTFLHKLNTILKSTPTLMFIYGPDGNEGHHNLLISLMSKSLYKLICYSENNDAKAEDLNPPLIPIPKSQSNATAYDSGDDSQPSSMHGTPLESFLQSVHKMDVQEVRNLFESAFAWKPGNTKTVECKLSVRGITQDECYEHYELVVTLLEKDEVFVSARSIESDIRLREELHGKLVQGTTQIEKAQQDSVHIRHVLGYVAHEYRNMYFGAQVLCEDILDELDETSLADDMAKVVRLHNRMGQLFDDVLLMQKIEANEYRYVYSTFKLNVVLEDVLCFATSRKAKNAPLNQNLDIEFMSHIAPGVGDCKIVGSSTHLFQALTNLLSNAFKYNALGGSVSLESFIEGDRVCIIVRDTGIGIPSQKRELIFEPYKRLATGSHRAGTGLGLPFAREFIEKGNHGTITVLDNERDGKGTVFRILIPIKREDDAESSKSSTTSIGEKLATEPKHEKVNADNIDLACEAKDLYDILIVDDDDIIRLALTRSLKKLAQKKHNRNLRILEARTGEHALQLILEEGKSFGLITMDQDMEQHGYTGSETIKILRDGGYQGLIIGLTGCEAANETQQMIQAGAQQVLVKGPRVFSSVIAAFTKLFSDDEEETEETPRDKVQNMRE